MKLGRNQHDWLAAIADHCNGRWYHGAAAIWTNYSGSVRLCESLTRRGLLREVADPIPATRYRAAATRRAWEITKAGRAYLKAHPIWEG